MAKATKLKNLLIDRVDLVDKGANPEARIVLFKRDTNGESTSSTQLASVDEASGYFVNNGDHKERNLLKSAWELIAKHLGFSVDIDVRPKINGADITKSDEGGDVKMSEQTANLDELLKGVDEKIREAVKAALAKRDEELEALRRRVDELSKKGEDKSDDINKADLPEPVRKRLEDLERRAKEAEEIAKAEREARIKAEIRKRAENYANVAKVDDIADVIYKAQSVSAEFAEKLEAILKAANERIEKGALFKELGTSASASDDPVAEFAQLVQKRMEADKIPYYEAARKVAAERPDLAKAWYESAPIGSP